MSFQDSYLITLAGALLDQSLVTGARRTNLEVVLEVEVDLEVGRSDGLRPR
jgi:hypothetical protein